MYGIGFLAYWRHVIRVPNRTNISLLYYRKHVHNYLSYFSYCNQIITGHTYYICMYICKGQTVKEQFCVTKNLPHLIILDCN